MNRPEFKIRIKNLIIYLLVLAVLVFLLLFNHRRVIVIFITAQLICIIPAILLLARKITLPAFSMKMEKELQNVGESNAVITKLTAIGVYPFARIEMKYNIYHSMEKDKPHFFTDYFSLFAGSKEYRYNLAFDYCGIYHIEACEIRVYDMLGIVMTMLPPVEAHATVMPAKYPMEVNDEKLALNRQEEDFNDPSKGMDVSEIRELREYRDGDKLSQVHWKLSTKSEDLIVKEYERQAGTCVVISCAADYSKLSEINDYYDFLYSFGMAMLGAEYYFDLVYYDSSLETLTSCNINNSYDFEIAIQNMYYNVAPIGIVEMEEYYREKFGKSKLFILTGQDIESAEFRFVDSHKRYKLFAEI